MGQVVHKVLSNGSGKCMAPPVRIWIAAGMLLALAACGEGPQPPAHLRIVGGDAERGRALIARYECGSCHRIEGIRGADGVAGPPLTDYAQRVLLAGIVPNVPRMLVPWLMNPPAIDPNTAMPNLGIGAAEARDIATYLYTLGAEKVRVWPADAQPYARQQGEAAILPGGSEASSLEGAAIERAMDALADQGERP